MNHIFAFIGKLIWGWKSKVATVICLVPQLREMEHLGSRLGVSFSLHDHVRRVIRTQYDSSSFQKGAFQEDKPSMQRPMKLLLALCSLMSHWTNKIFFCCLKSQWSLIVFFKYSYLLILMFSCVLNSSMQTYYSCLHFILLEISLV